MGNPAQDFPAAVPSEICAGRAIRCNLFCSAYPLTKKDFRCYPYCGAALKFTVSNKSRLDFPEFKSSFDEAVQINSFSEISTEFLKDFRRNFQIIVHQTGIEENPQRFRFGEVFIFRNYVGRHTICIQKSFNTGIKREYFPIFKVQNSLCRTKKYL